MTVETTSEKQLSELMANPLGRSRSPHERCSRGGPGACSSVGAKSGRPSCQSTSLAQNALFDISCLNTEDKACLLDIGELPIDISKLPIDIGEIYIGAIPIGEIPINTPAEHTKSLGENLYTPGGRGASIWTNCVPDIALMGLRFPRGEVRTCGEERPPKD